MPTPKITAAQGLDMFLIMRGMMCSHCNMKVRDACYVQSRDKQYSTVIHCMCELGVMERNDEKYPAQLPVTEGI